MRFSIADDDVKIAYRIVGHGPERVACIHGFNCSSNSFNWMLPYFLTDRYTFLLPDLRGCGHSDKPTAGYTLTQFARDILAVLQHAGWDNYTLVGHSFGGTIAQWMAAELDAAVKALILINPIPATGVCMSPEDVELFRAAAESLEGKASVWQRGWHQPIAADILTTLVGDSQTCRREALLAMVNAAQSANFPRRLATISAPTLVVGTNASPFLSEVFLRETVVANIAGACYVQAAHSSQYIHIEQASHIAGVIGGFIAAQS